MLAERLALLGRVLHCVERLRRPPVSEAADAVRAYRCFPAGSPQRMSKLQSMRDAASRGAKSRRRLAKRFFKQRASGTPSAFGHWCATRHCMINAKSGRAIAGLVPVVIFGNAYVFWWMPPPLHPGLLHPGLCSPDSISSCCHC